MASRPAAVTHQHDSFKDSHTAPSLELPARAHAISGTGLPEPKPFHALMNSGQGPQREAQPMSSIPVADMVLTVAVMTIAFVGEVAVFALLGIF